MRPLRSEGVARRSKVAHFDLGEWRMAKKYANSDHLQRKSLTWVARVMQERTENVAG